MNRIHALYAGLGALILSAQLAATEESEKKAEPQSVPAAQIVPKAAKITYVPPRRGAPSTRVGGASRSAQGLTNLEVLAAQQTGHTLQEQPDLYWYLSRPANSPVELTVIDEGDERAVQPLLAFNLAPPVEAGIHRLRLADHGVRLRQGGLYRWSVALVPDPEQRSHDLIASGTLQRGEPSQSLAAKLTGADRQALPFLYAEAGFWYDAIAAVSELIETHPADSGFRALRAALLEQVELPEVAGRDRRREDGK